MRTAYDAVIIGTGQSGPSLAARLAGAGHHVAVVERGRFGGTCVNYGCVPTKTLVASARAAYMARRAGDFGVRTGEVSVDMAAVKARKDEIAGASNQGVEKWMKGLTGVDVYEGHARFTDPHTVSVDGRAVQGERFFINTGARASVPPIEGLERVDYLTNRTMLDVDFLPEHLVIIGASYIGLEFAQMFRRFGSRVTVVERGERVIGREDPDISAAVQEILENEGVTVRTGAECMAVQPRDGGVAVDLDCTSGERVVEGSHLLVAVGRTPNTDELGLDKAGVATDERGFIRVDEHLQTSVRHIWAMGDVNGRGAFTHTSYNDYEIVAANLLEEADRRVTDRHTIYGLFVDPPLGRVGLTEQQVRDAGLPAQVATLPMSRVGRARERGETQGLMKAVVHAETGRILGAAVLGINGDEVVHTFATAMYADAPYTLLQRVVHIHPTVNELLPTLLARLEPLD